MRVSALKSKILWRVYLVWLFKRILPLIIAEILIILGAIYLLAKFIFVKEVVDNALLNSASNPLRLAEFLFFAFLATHWATKIAVIVFLALGALFLRDLGRTLASYRSTSKVTRPVKPN